MVKIMDKKLVKKSCKICSALLIGVIVGYGLTKLLEKDKKEEHNQPSCGCSS
jgi:hypothetical protein